MSSSLPFTMFIESNAGEYFVATLPAGDWFKLNFDEIKFLVEKSTDGILNTTAEVCLVALVSYFEAYCKNQFAAIINICPQTLECFIEKRKDVSLALGDLMVMKFNLKKQLGFLLAEKYDFGSAKNINSLYSDLLNITPFSKDEARLFDDLLNDRNLLVHHSGICTMKYHKQRFTKQKFKDRIFIDTLVIQKEHFNKWANFVESMVIKINESSYMATADFVNKSKIKLSKSAKVALEFLRSYD